LKGNAKNIIVLCEGKTEKRAVKYFIGPQWEKHGLGSIALVTKNLRAKLEDVFKRVPIHRNEPGVLAVFTLIDLYGMNRVRHKPDSTLEQKVEAVRAWLRDDFDNDLQAFFHPHIAVHELEAWLLADGKCIGPDVKPLANAEEKNFQNPPKARIKEMLARRRKGDGYREAIDGEIMFKRARFDVVYHGCPYFRAFYDDLKEVAEAALQDQAI